jgi:membrane-bound metal-dependent hydrolase YbcI (DUF457 family)
LRQCSRYDLRQSVRQEVGDFPGSIHVLISLALFAFVKFEVYNPLPINLMFVIGLVVGSVLPDADTPQSPAGIVMLWTVFKHRHQIHSVMAMFTLSALAILFLGRTFGIGLFVGYGLHLLFDGMTPTGLPYLWFPWRYRGKEKEG